MYKDMRQLKINQRAFTRFEANPSDPRSKREQFLYPFYTEPSIWYEGKWEVCDGYSGSVIITRSKEKAILVALQCNEHHLQDYIAVGTVMEEKGAKCG